MIRAFALALCLLAMGATALAATPAPNTSTTPAASAQPSLPLGLSQEALRKLFDKVVRTGLGRDGIPALNNPRYVTVSDASLAMDDNEVVFVVFYPEGRIRVYPQRIMVWHEVVNDVLPDAADNMPQPGSPEAAGKAYTISYSPLTGTVTAFRSMAGQYASSFGVTGDLLFNNSVLYDRISLSQWSQLLALCIDGPLKGKRLERIPVLWATWKGVREAYNGKAEVLSRATGHKRTYGRDPYGSYQGTGTYYDNSRLVHPMPTLDTRLPAKKRILGIEQESIRGAVQVQEVKNNLYLNFTMGIVPMVALYDKNMDAVRVFDRRLDGDARNVLTFSFFENQFVDETTKSQWAPDGECTYGRYNGKRLTPVLAIDSMWFAWAAFHRQSMLFPPAAQ